MLMNSQMKRINQIASRPGKKAANILQWKFALLWMLACQRGIGRGSWFSNPVNTAEMPVAVSPSTL